MAGPTNGNKPARPDPLAGDDLLWRHLKTVPAFRALLRSVEARFYRAFPLEGPVLDMGCGDGHFARMTFAEAGEPAKPWLDVGIDPWWGPLRKSQRAGVYGGLAQALGDRLPFPDQTFGTVISNSVLEHIPDVQPVLDDVSRVLVPGGLLLVTMPSHRFTDWLGGAALCERLGLDGAADAYRRLFNRLSRHAHTDDAETWAARLAGAGFVVERWQYYFSLGALRALEWGHVQGLPAAISHAITGHWILGPYERSLRHTERWLRPFYEEPFPTEGAYQFIAARKRADGPIAVSLPAAHPFTRDELEVATAIGAAAGEAPMPAEPASLPAPTVAPAPAPARPLAAPRRDRASSRWLAPMLAGLALALGSLGLSAWRAQPESPSFGTWLIGLALLSMAGSTWLARVRPSRTGDEAPAARRDRRRWLVAPAVLLSLLAPSFVAGPLPEVQRPLLALVAWLAGIALGGFALSPAEPRRGLRARLAVVSRGEWVLLAGLFYFALTVRAYALTTHPFILNGTEANLGLEAWRVASGQLRNPFATGWLTNPTLPFFLAAPAMDLFGRSVLTARLLSPIVGALTVVAVYGLGRRLWGRGVALPAAILLAGAHAHVHYSRLGMTNIWDPLAVLLAVGLLGLAMRRGDRQTWLLAGLASGAGAYFFTSGHLLPLIVPAGLLLWSIARPDGWRRQWRHVAAAALLTALVALPLVRHYQSSPGLFMDRANALGIFQSGWLAREADGTGRETAALLADQFRKAALGFTALEDSSQAYNPGRPLLAYFPAMLATLGLALSLWRWRRPRYVWLVIWVVVTIVFAGALLLSPPASHRLLVALPAACLLAGVALDWFGRRIGGALHLSRRRQRLALAGLAVVLAVGDVAFYYGPYRTEQRFGDRNSEVAARVGEYLSTLDSDGTVVFFHGAPSMFADFPTIPFLAEDFVPGQNLLDVVEPGIPPIPPGAGRLRFVLVPERSLEIGGLRAAFPNGQARTFPGVFADPLFYVYEVELEHTP